MRRLRRNFVAFIVGGGNTVTPNSSTPSTPAPATTTPATPAPAISIPNVPYDTLSEEQKTAFLNKVDKKANDWFRGFSADRGSLPGDSLGYWQVLQNGNLQLHITKGPLKDENGQSYYYAHYYELTKNEVVQLWEYSDNLIRERAKASLGSPNFTYISVISVDDTNSMATAYLESTKSAGGMGKQPTVNPGKLRTSINKDSYVHIDPLQYIVNILQ